MIHLPDEILNMICLYLHPDKDRDDYSNGATPRELVNMTMVSRSFYHAVRPVLYHTVSTIGSEDAIVRLVRSFVDSPNNPDHVRKIVIDSGADGETLTDGLSHEDLSRASALAGALKIPSELRAELVSEVDRATHDGLTCLILCLCRNVHTVAVQAYRSAGGNFSKHFVASLITRYQTMDDPPVGESKQFQKVESIHLRPARASGDRTPLAAYLYWLNLPRLEILLCENVDLTRGWEYVHGRGPLAKTKLRRLLLHESLVDHNSLQNLLPVCPDLVELHIVWDGIDEGDFPIDFESIGRMLRQHGSSLQKLHLDSGELIPSKWKKRKVIGSLASLHHLRELFIYWNFLFSIDDVLDGIKRDSLVEILPTSLEELEIYFDWGYDSESPGDGGLDAQFLTLMRSERFEALRRIRINRDEPYGFEAPSSWRVSFEEIPYDGELSMLLERVE